MPKSEAVPVLYLMGDYGPVWVVYHSDYKGWQLFREWDIVGKHGRMSYFAVNDGDEPLHAKNLSGIKDAVSTEVGA